MPVVEYAPQQKHPHALGTMLHNKSSHFCKKSEHLNDRLSPTRHNCNKAWAATKIQHSQKKKKTKQTVFFLFYLCGEVLRMGKRLTWLLIIFSQHSRHCNRVVTQQCHVKYTREPQKCLSGSMPSLRPTPLLELWGVCRQGLRHDYLSVVHQSP